MDPRPKPDRFDPRSPVQGPRSSAPYFVVAVFAAIAIWTAQQISFEDWAFKPTPFGDSGHTHPLQAKAKGDLRRIFSSDDYPLSAQMRGIEGSVRAELEVDTRGRVRRCSIITSSNSSAIDDATCRILKERARFTPARDVNGKAAPDTIVTPMIVWRLEH